MENTLPQVDVPDAVHMQSCRDRLASFGLTVLE